MANVLRKMNIVSRCAGMYRSEQLSNSEVVPFPHGLVIAICRHPGRTQDQLSRHLCMNKSMITRRLAQLEEHGYVTRVPGESDKRVMQVYPTERLQELFPRVREIAKTWNDAVTEGISEEEMQIFQSVLDRIAARSRELAGIPDDTEAETK